MPTYDHEFFEGRSKRANSDARALAIAATAALGKPPSTIIDCGCGDGSLLRWWRTTGAERLVGTDPYGPETWRVSAPDGTPLIDPGSEQWRCSLAFNPTREEFSARFDLACCIEAAEHMGQEYAGAIVDALTRWSDRVLFSAAHPGQGGEGHLNEQPLAYWVRLFRSRGYRLFDVIRGRLDASWWLRQNAVLFCKRGHDPPSASVVALLPQYGRANPEVRAVINALRIPFLRIKGEACVDVARNTLAARFLRETDATHALWLDADMVPRTQQLADLVTAAVAYDLDVAALPYVTKTRPHRIVHGDVLADTLAVGPLVPPQSAQFVGFGATVTSRAAFERVDAWSAGRHPLACRVAGYGGGIVGRDYFRPGLGEPEPYRDPDTGRPVRPYLREDQSFCRRVWLAGGNVAIVPRSWVGHRGTRDYGEKDL